jgi:hypothetical protein
MKALSYANSSPANNWSRYDFRTNQEVFHVSTSKSSLSHDPKKRKPYKGPTLTKLTPEKARTALEAKGLPDDENVQKLMEAVKLILGEKK